MTSAWGDVLREGRALYRRDRPQYRKYLEHQNPGRAPAVMWIDSSSCRFRREMEPSASPAACPAVPSAHLDGHHSTRRTQERGPRRFDFQSNSRSEPADRVKVIVSVSHSDDLQLARGACDSTASTDLHPSLRLGDESVLRDSTRHGSLALRGACELALTKNVLVPLLIGAPLYK